MKVQVEYQEDSHNIDEYLRHAQTIINAFTKALDQNECNVKILIGTHNELTEQRDELKDLWDMTNTSDTQKDKKRRKRPIKSDSKKGQDYVRTIIDDPEKKIDDKVFEHVKDDMLHKCIPCKMKWPKIKFNNSLKFSFDKLKASLQAYTDAFDKLKNPNLCHAAALFNFSCFQDIIKLLVLLLSLYASILALRKLSGISLAGFIKGIISGLLNSIVGSLSIQADMSETGLSCLINALDVLAKRIPSGYQMVGYVPEDWIKEDPDNPEEEYIEEPNVIEYRDDITGEKMIKVDTENPKKVPINKSSEDDSYNPFSAQKIKEALDALKQQGSDYTSNTKDRINSTSSAVNNEKFSDTFTNEKHKNLLQRFTDELKKQSDEGEKLVDGALKLVNNVVKEAQSDLNKQIAGMFGLLDHFQCESARSGTNYIELLDFINQVINVINLLSSILAIVAKKQVQKLCATRASTFDDNIKEDINNNLNSWKFEGDGLIGDGLIQEFMGKAQKNLKDDDIVPLILNEDVGTILPKLSLDTCNFHEFLEAHTPDNIIKRAIEVVREENGIESDITRKTNNSDITSFKFNKDYYTESNNMDNVLTKGDKGERSSFSEVINKNKWNLYPIQFIKPNFDYTTLNSDNVIKNNEKVLSVNEDISYGIKTVLDFIYNNPSDKIDPPNKDRESMTEELVDFFKPNVDNTNIVSRPINNNKSNLENPKESLYKPDSESYLNTCRDINDVLDILENMKRS